MDIKRQDENTLSSCEVFRIGATAIEGKPSLQDVLEHLNKQWGSCIALYTHGSAVFRNKTPADIDLLAVVDEPTIRPVFCASVDSQFKLGKFEVSVYTRSFWLDKLARMDLTMLTCLFLPPEFVLHEEKFFHEEVHSVNIRPLQLFEASRVYAEFTWIKARTLLKACDLHKSCKNVSYVFRVLELAAQILQHGRIMDFHAANHWWDRVLNIYSSTPILPSDWDLIEAIFARSFQEEILRVSEFAVYHSGKFAAKSSVQILENVDHSGQTCVSCSRPLDPSAEFTSCVHLPRCTHKLHFGCALLRCRSTTGLTSCPACEAPWRLDLDKSFIFERDSEIRGTRQWLRVVRRRWRRRLDLAIPQLDPDATPDFLKTAKLAQEAAKFMAFEARDASRPERILEELLNESACPIPLGGDTVAMFFGYPPTQLTLEEAMPQQVITLAVDVNVVTGNTLSGDEVFCIEANGKMLVEELREGIAAEMRCAIAAVKLLEDGALVSGDLLVQNLRAPVAFLTIAEAMKSRFFEELDHRISERGKLYDEWNRKRQKYYEILQPIKEDRVRRKLEEKRRRLEEQRLQFRLHQQQLKVDEKRLLGFIHRRAQPAGLSRKAGIEAHRSQEACKALQRLSNLAAKQIRLSAHTTKIQQKRLNYRKSKAASYKLQFSRVIDMDDEFV